MATIPGNQKILTSAPEVNTTYGGPASLQALNKWYTMDDISNTIRPYKVYTALLTQSGTDSPVATVLENTLEFNPSWEYFETGKYGFNFPTPPDYNKIVIFISNNLGYNYFYALNTDYNILIRTVSGGDNEYDNTPIEIRVYN